MILASGSPRRAVLLRYLCEFDVKPVKINEVAPRALSIPDAVEVIARKKALAASERDPEEWVLGADTVVHRGDVLLHKPRSESEARTHLATLSGGVHQVTTGVALVHDERAVDAVAVSTTVRFERLPREVLEAYLDAESWVGKAGGYGIQDEALAPYITIEGSWSNVVGLPLAETAAILRRFDLPCEDPPSEDLLRDHNPFESPAK